MKLYSHGILTCTHAINLMDLMSLATFVGQSSTIKNDTVTKTRLYRVNVQNERCSRKVAHINRAIRRSVLTGNKHRCVSRNGVGIKESDP